MSRLPDNEPKSAPGDHAAIDVVVESRPRDLGGFTVRRTLPAAIRRHVGSFVFFDHMGPVVFPPGRGIDVRPHPHIGLATITYLFDGEILHKDSLGSDQAIRPGDVNWMVAGRGVAHSERSAPAVRGSGGPVHGIQTWVALPQKDEETEPRFEHHPRKTLPVVSRPGVELVLIAGTGFGARAPTGVLSPTLYAHARFEPGGALMLDPEHEERAVYVVDGTVACDGRSFGEGVLFVLHPGAHAEIRAETKANVMLIGGAPLDGDRHIYWNFVSSSHERIERAKKDWREDRVERFPKVPGDDVERIPLPED